MKLIFNKNQEKNIEFLPNYQLEVFLTLARFRGDLKGDVHQKHCNQSYTNSNLNICRNIPKIHFSSSFSNKTVKSKNSVPKRTYIVKTTNSFGFFGKTMVGPTNAPANKAAEILIDSPDNAFSQGLKKTFSINSNLTKRLNFVKQIPLEYAVELNRLIQLEMEGAVG